MIKDERIKKHTEKRIEGEKRENERNRKMEKRERAREKDGEREEKKHEENKKWWEEREISHRLIEEKRQVIKFLIYKEGNLSIKKLKKKWSGGTSKVYMISCNKFVIKQITKKCYKYDIFEREIYILEYLERNNIDWAPKLIKYDYEKKLIMITYCGELLTEYNKPKDCMKQINNIKKDMELLNIQHNDISSYVESKHSTYLLKKGYNKSFYVLDNKIYLIDYGWASIGKDHSFGIGLCGVKPRIKKGPVYYNGALSPGDDLMFKDFKLVGNSLTYKDPIRKIGSQKETPIINFKNDNIIVGGYQQFIINKKTKKIEFISKKNKFNYVNDLIHTLKNKYNCTSIIDIGCNSGLVSLIAFNNGFEYIVSLDHDKEYIDTLHTIKEYCNITRINESLYSFGDIITEKFDVVFCGALIHWVFSFTSDFRNFDNIILYLVSLTKKYLVIEWVKPNDYAIKSLNHIKARKLECDEVYNTENFEISVKKFTNIILKENADRETRTMYLCKKK